MKGTQKHFVGVKALLKRMLEEINHSEYPSVNLLRAFDKSLALSLQELYDKGIR